MPAPKRVAPRGHAAPPPPVDETPAPKKAAAKKRAVKKAAEGFAVRNIRAFIVRATLDETRIELLPRGQRGDLAYVSEEQMADPWFAPNVGMVYEVITRAEARNIIEKQSTNQQVGPTLADQLLNPKGESYEQEPTMGPSNEEQSVTVAGVSQGGSTRNLQETSNVERLTGLAAQEQIDAVARAANGDSAGDELRQAVQVNVEPTQRG